MKPGIEALQAVPLLSGFDTAALSELNEVADLVRLGPGDMAFRPGDQLSELTFLTRGQAAGVQEDSRGETILIDVLTPIRPLCLPAALLGLPAPVGIRSLSSTRLIVIPVAAIRARLHASSETGAPFLEQALLEAHELTQAVVELKSRSAARRLADFLLGQLTDPDMRPARFVLPFEKRLLAARIGCSQENLSRAFGALRDHSVQTEGAVVVIGDPAALRDFAAARRQRRPRDSART